MKEDATVTADRPLRADQPQPGVTRRPRNRKAQIIKVAAIAFGERGYHPVGVDEIAAEIGISGPALYRHFPNKYALLVAVADHLVESLIDASEAAQAIADPRERLTTTLREFMANTIENRRGGGVYRWESQYLEPADRDRFRARWLEVNERVARPLRQLRPDCDDADIAALAAAALSVVASVTVHRTVLGTRRIEALLCDMLRAVLACDLPPRAPEPIPRPVADAGLAVLSKRELLLTTALANFHTHGYHEASIEEIGVAAGMTASSVYRHFASKADLLAALFYRTSERLSVITADALAESPDSATALRNLADRYVTSAFTHPELLSIYYAEFANLPQHERKNLRALQQQHIDQWTHLVTTELPGLPAVDARFRVHAALGLVLDLGRLIRFDFHPRSRARVVALMLTALLAEPHSSPQETGTTS